MEQRWQAVLLIVVILIGPQMQKDNHFLMNPIIVMVELFGEQAVPELTEDKYSIRCES